MIVYPPDWVYTVYHVLFIVCSIGFFGQIIMWIIKRKNFYLRNGLTETALYVKLFGVEMEILSDSCKINFEEYRRLYTDTFGENYVGHHIKLLSEGK